MEIYQIIEKYSKEPEVAIRLAHECSWLQSLLLLVKEEWLLPEGKPEVGFKYIERSIEAESTLRNEMRRLKAFYKDPNGQNLYPNMNRVKRESLFVDIIQNIPLVEVDLLVAIKDGDISKFSWMQKA